MNENKLNILFLLSHQPNPRFVKQIKFLSQKNNVILIYFYRNIMNDLLEDYKYDVKQIFILDIIPDSLSSISNYFNRIWKYVTSIITLNKKLNEYQIDICITNNIDMQLMYNISSIFKSKQTTKVIQISDLLSYHQSTSLNAKIFLFLEKIVFRSVDKLIVTSEKFFTEHYKNFFKGTYFVLENKPLKSLLPEKVPKNKNSKRIIGIVGLLLQLDVYERLFEAVKNDSRYEVHIYGMGKYAEKITAYARQIENVKYCGPYKFFNDASKIYSSIDILYMPYSKINKSMNNRLALPNKLYEAMYYKVPIITSKNTYLGSRVIDLSIGLQTNYQNLEDLKCSLEMIFNNYNKYVKNLNELDANLFLADKDYKKLEKFLTRDLRML